MTTRINFNGTMPDEIIEMAGVVDFGQDADTFWVQFDTPRNAESGTKIIWFDHDCTPMIPANTKPIQQVHSRCKGRWVKTICHNCACQWDCEHQPIDGSDC